MSKILPMVLVVTFHFSMAWAQVNTGGVLGTVQDATGGVLPGVEVTVTHVDTGTSRTVITDEAGRYQVSNLNFVGNYELVASLPGFQTAVRSGVAIEMAQRIVVNFTLAVGEISQRITVTGEAPLVETTSGSLGALVDRNTVLELPLNGRDLTRLLTLQAGTTFVSTGSKNANAGFSTRVSISGARPQDAAVMLDGTTTKGTDQGVPAGVSGNFLGAEGIQEFKIERNSYGAQYGGASGGIINVVSKAGSNTFHGSVYDLHRNDNLDASNFFTNRDGLEKPPLVRNQFGFSLGGPVIKDKTFFFWNYEGFRERRSDSTTRLLPTLATRQGLLPTGPNGELEQVAGLDPKVLPFFALWPDPSASAVDLGDGTAREGANLPQATDENYWQIRIDHKISDSDSIFGRFTWENSDRDRPQPIARWSATDFVRNRFLTLEHKHIFSPQTLNTFRFGFGRRNGGQFASEDCPSCDPSLHFVPDQFWQAPLGSDPVQGQIDITGVSRVGIAAPSNGAGWLVAETDNYSYSDDIIYNRGAHSWKIGFSALHLLTGGENPSRPAGVFTFSNLTNFLTANPSQFRGTILPGLDAKREIHYNIIGWYIQDDWQLTSRLTLNLGLRHEFYTIPSEVDGKISNLKSPLTDTEITVLGTRGDGFFKNPSKDSFMPRIGLAWDPTGSGKTAIRLGAGLFFNQIQPDVFRRAIFRNAPFIKETNFRTPTPAFPNIFDQVVNQGIGNIDIQPFAYDYMQSPHTYQWNLNIEREIVSGLAGSVGYVGSRGLNLLHQTCLNTATAENVKGRLVFPDDAQRPNQAPLFRSLCLLSQEASTDSWYNALQLGLKRRLADGFQLQLSYTFSRTVSESDQVNGIFGNNGNGVPYYPNPDLYRGLAAFHVGNVFTGSGVWQLPFGNNLRGPAGKILGGWQISGIVSLADGPPTTVSISTTRAVQSLGFNGRTQPADVVPGASSSPVLGGPDQYFDLSAFQPPPKNEGGSKAGTIRTLGNGGRNTLIGPGIANVDLSFTKNTLVSEAVNVQFRAEIFNIFNRANFALPDPRVFGSTGRPNGSAGRIDSTVQTERQIQLALRVEF